LAAARLLAALSGETCRRTCWHLDRPHDL